MYGSAEAACVEALIKFIRETPDFRAMTFQDDTKLYEKIEMDRVFVLVKGSFLSRDVVIAILTNYDLADLEKMDSVVSLLCRISCTPPAEGKFSREKDTDRVAKKIGVNPEIEVGDDFIDETYLIKAQNKDMFSAIATGEPLKSFLENNAPTLEKLELKPGWIEFQRSFTKDSGPQSIMQDLRKLVEIAESFNTTVQIR